jgi:hypothetical protein
MSWTHPLMVTVPSPTAILPESLNAVMMFNPIDSSFI